MTTDEDNKRLKTELSEMKARHRLEIERVTREKEQEMDEVHKRSVSHEFVHYETFFSRTNGRGLSTNDWKRTRTGERRFSFTTFRIARLAREIPRFRIWASCLASSRFGRLASPIANFYQKVFCSLMNVWYHSFSLLHIVSRNLL